VSDQILYLGHGLQKPVTTTDGGIYLGEEDDAYPHVNFCGGPMFTAERPRDRRLDVVFWVALSEIAASAKNSQFRLGDITYTFAGPRGLSLLVWNSLTIVGKVVVIEDDLQFNGRRYQLRTEGKDTGPYVLSITWSYSPTGERHYIVVPSEKNRVKSYTKAVNGDDDLMRLDLVRDWAKLVLGINT